MLGKIIFSLLMFCIWVKFILGCCFNLEIIDGNCLSFCVIVEFLNFNLLYFFFKVFWKVLIGYVCKECYVVSILKVFIFLVLLVFELIKVLFVCFKIFVFGIIIFFELFIINI